MYVKVRHWSAAKFAETTFAELFAPLPNDTTLRCIVSLPKKQVYHALRSRPLTISVLPPLRWHPGGRHCAKRYYQHPGQTSFWLEWGSGSGDQ